MRPFILLCCAACGLNPQNLTATHFVAASLVEAPKVQSGGTTSPEGAALTVFFGDIDAAKAAQGLTQDAITPRAGATVTVAWTSASSGAHTVAVADKTGGKYEVDSASNSALAVEKGVDYKLTIAFGGETFTADVTPGDPVQMTDFSSGPVQNWSKAQDFVAHRAGGGGAPPAFLTVAKLDTSDPTNQNNITFTNAPRDPLALLKFVVDDSAFKAATETAPAATAFPQTGQYVVTLTGATRGTTSDNLFAGSAFLGMTGSAGILNVQ